MRAVQRELRSGAREQRGGAGRARRRSELHRVYDAAGRAVDLPPEGS